MKRTLASFVLIVGVEAVGTATAYAQDARVREFKARIVKCSAKTQKRCIIRVGSGAIPSLQSRSRERNIIFYLKGKPVFSVRKMSLKPSKRKNAVAGTIRWRVKGAERKSLAQSLAKTKQILHFRVPHIRLSALKPTTAEKSGERLESDGSSWFTAFLSSYLGWIGTLILVGYGIHRVVRVNRKNEVAKAEFQKAIAKDQHLPATLHPIVNPDLCGACGACVKACPEGEIIKLINHKAVLVNPTKCVGHSLCEAVCPYDAIDLVFGTEDKPQQIPKIAGNYETNVNGLYIAGELGGMGLIGNAIRQGTLAAKDAIASLKSIDSEADYDLLIVGAGPAGMAAGCQATVDKVKYVILEQNSFGGTVNNFPRGKVVMNRPCEFAGYGKTKFPSNKVSKEALLETWEDVRKDMDLKIKEKTKFDSLEKKGDLFSVETSEGTMTAKKVLLCMGVGGSPRKLGLPNEDSGKVAYRLIDAADYQSKTIAIVGGGNSALEAAQYLSDARYGNRVVLLVRKDMSKSNQDNQDLVQKQVDAGRLKVLLKASIKEIGTDSIVVAADGKSMEIDNDNVFVFAGAVMPWSFLEGLGIEIEMKTGQSTKWGHTPTEAHRSFLKGG